MASDRFTFKIEDVEHSLPKQIPFGALRKARGFDLIDQIGIILEDVADPETLAALDQLDPSDVVKKIRPWFKGATPGESSSSSN